MGLLRSGRSYGLRPPHRKPKVTISVFSSNMTNPRDPTTPQTQNNNTQPPALNFHQQVRQMSITPQVGPSSALHPTENGNMNTSLAPAVVQSQIPNPNSSLFQSNGHQVQFPSSTNPIHPHLFQQMLNNMNATNQNGEQSNFRKDSFNAYQQDGRQYDLDEESKRKIKSHKEMVLEFISEFMDRSLVIMVDKLFQNKFLAHHELRKLGGERRGKYDYDNGEYGTPKRHRRW